MSGELIANVSCVSIGGRALLIEGPPGSGKSSLALALIDRGATLVGDDGVVVEERDGMLHAFPPPNISGKLEIRGVGIVDFKTGQAPLALALLLDENAPRSPEPSTREILGHEFPAIAFRPGDANQALRAEHALAQFGTH